MDRSVNDHPTPWKKQGEKLCARCVLGRAIVAGGHVATIMPAMKMSSCREEQDERGELMVMLFSASSSIRISWSRHSALQNAFSLLQSHTTDQFLSEDALKEQLWYQIMQSD